MSILQDSSNSKFRDIEHPSSSADKTVSNEMKSSSCLALPTPALMSENSENSSGTEIIIKTSSVPIQTSCPLENKSTSYWNNGTQEESRTNLEDGKTELGRIEQSSSSTTTVLSESLSLLLLPGVEDRRKIVVEVGKLEVMTPLDALSCDDISTEIGSGSRHACSSSVDSGCSNLPFRNPAISEVFFQHQSSDVNKVLSAREEVLGEQQSRLYASDETTRHEYQIGATNFLSFTLERIADEDATPENRFFHENMHNMLRPEQWKSSCERSERDGVSGFGVNNPPHHSNLSAPCIISDATPINSEGSATPHISSIQDVPSPEHPLEILHPRSHNSAATTAGLRIPGLMSVQSTPAKPSCKSFPWRIKYVPVNGFGLPSSHECLTDDTTADGCQDYEDEDDDDGDENDDDSGDSDNDDDSGIDSDINNETNLELPPGVSKKVRFLPLQPSAIHEYEKFDWRAEEEEANIFIVSPRLTALPDSILLQQPDPHHHILHCLEETPVAADSGVYADPVQMFIPLIESNRSMVLEEFSLSSSDSPSEGDDQEDRESILTSRTRSKTEAGASESRKLKTDSFQNMKSDKEQSAPRTKGDFSNSYNWRQCTRKSRDSTPHPSHQTFRSSSITSSLARESSKSPSPIAHNSTASSEVSTESPFFPCVEDPFRSKDSNESHHHHPLSNLANNNSSNIGSITDGNLEILSLELSNESLEQRPKEKHSLKSGHLREDPCSTPVSTTKQPGNTSDIECALSFPSIPTYSSNVSRLLLKAEDHGGPDAEPSIPSVLLSDINFSVDLGSPTSSLSPEKFTLGATNSCIPHCSDLPSDPLVPLYPSSVESSGTHGPLSLDSSEFLCPSCICQLTTDSEEINNREAAPKRPLSRPSASLEPDAPAAAINLITLSPRRIPYEVAKCHENGMYQDGILFTHDHNNKRVSFASQVDFPTADSHYEKKDNGNCRGSSSPHSYYSLEVLTTVSSSLSGRSGLRQSKKQNVESSLDGKPKVKKLKSSNGNTTIETQ